MPLIFWGQWMVSDISDQLFSNMKRYSSATTYDTKWYKITKCNKNFLHPLCLIETCGQALSTCVFEHHFEVVETLAQWYYHGLSVNRDSSLHMGRTIEFFADFFAEHARYADPLHGNHRGCELWRCTAASPWSVEAGDFLGHSIRCPRRPGGSKCRPEASFSTNGSSSGDTFD